MKINLYRNTSAIFNIRKEIKLGRPKKIQINKGNMISFKEIIF